MQRDNRSTTGMTVWSWVFYGLALIVAVAALLIGLSVGGAAAAVPAAAIGFQSPALKPLWDALVNALQSLGWLVFVSGLVMSALLLCGGLLLSYIVTLARRVNQLETALASAQPGRREP